MSYDRRSAAAGPKRDWRLEGPKKWAFSDDEGWEGRLIRSKATDAEWIAQFSINGTTWNVIHPEDRFTDPDEGKVAVEAFIVSLIKRQLAKYQ